MGSETADQVRDEEDVELAWLGRRAGHVSKAVKGLLLGLAAALGLELTNDPGAALLALLGTVVAVVVGNVYADAIQFEIERGTIFGRRALASTADHSLGILIGAIPALVLFTLAWLDIVDIDLAIDLAIWSGIGLLAVLGYVGGRLGGGTRRDAVVHGVLLAGLGIVVLAVKSLH